MPIIIPANSAVAGGFDVANSIRLDNNAYLNRTFSETGAGAGGGTFKWTLSLWFKRSALTDEHVIMSRYVNSGKYVVIKINGNNKLEYRVYNGGDQIRLTTTAVLRDSSAWLHIVIAQDTTLSTAADRVKFFINGSRVTSFDTNTQPNQNTGGDFNTGGAPHQIGAFNGGDEFQGYMSQICFVDNVQYAADKFGEFDANSSIWKPIDVSDLSTGATSFLLAFENSSALGTDSSGDNNNFSVNNITAIDQATDTCTNNFCTINPLWRANQTLTFSEGNTKGIGVSAFRPNNSTFAPSAGKWYMEGKLISGTSNKWFMGYGDQQWIDSNQNLASGTNMDWGGGNIAGGTNQRNVSLNNGWSNQLNLYPNSPITSFFSSSSVANDIIAMAVDLDNQKAWWSQNGVWRNGSATASTTFNASYPDTTQLDAGRNYYIATGSENSTWLVNYGNPAYAITSSNADGSGYGNFEYEVPSGFFSLCTKNLAEHG